MEKQKINMAEKLEKQREIKAFDMGDGVKIHAVSFIPFHEKESFALEWAGMTLQTDDALGICYTGYTDEVVEAYLTAKYYTDIDVEGVEPGIVFDYLTADNAFHEELMEYIMHDLYYVITMKECMADAVKARFEKENSLAHTVKGLLNTDPDVNNAETRELIEKLIDMKGALLEREENRKILDFGKKKAAKPVKTGGANINLAKKG